MFHDIFIKDFYYGLLLWSLVFYYGLLLWSLVLYSPL
jgi:hypothetical protein